MNPTKPSRKLLAASRSSSGAYPADAFRTSVRARVNEWEIVAKGDVVKVGDTTPPIIGQVVFHASVSLDGTVEVVSLISEYEVVAELPRC